MPELTQAEKFAQAASLQFPPPQGRGWKYYVKRGAIYLASAYVLLCLIFFFFQNRIVYRPAVSTELEVKKSIFAPPQGRDIEIQTSDGVTLNGWHLAANAKSFKKLSNAPLVLIYFGGHEGNRAGHEDKYCRFLSMGVDIVCFDYRGFGDSGGSPNEDAIARDARAIWDYAQKEGVAPGSIILYGESLGGAVAVRLAAELSAEKTTPAGVIVESSFSKLSDMESQLYPYLPVSLLLTQRYRSIDKIGGMESALLMFHGRRDSTVPLASGRALFEAAPAQSAGSSGIARQFIELPDCDHDNVGIENAQEYDEALLGLFKTICPNLAARQPHRPSKKPGRLSKEGTELHKKQPGQKPPAPKPATPTHTPPPVVSP